MSQNVSVKNIDTRQDCNKPWERLLEQYPALVEPIRESWNDPSSFVRKIYMITPTKTRAEQTPDLTRLAQTLYLVTKPSFSRQLFCIFLLYP